MDSTFVFSVEFSILMISLHFLNAISTCRPLTNQYAYVLSATTERHGHVNNHTASEPLKVNHDHTNGHSHDTIHDAPLVPALFAFGDSTVDAGNNNHLFTISRSNFLPYGRDLPNKKPTGRFCNGKLVTDYIASKLGLGQTMVAYLDIKKGVKEWLGCLDMPLHLKVSFASASSGFHDSTAKHFNALPLRKQLEHFKDFRQRMMKELGEEDAKEVLGKAMFIISTGTNDYLNNYLVNPFLRSKYSLHQFQTLVLELCAQFIKVDQHIIT